LPFEVALLETAQSPVYQRIAKKALQLRELGLSDRVIAARFGVTDKTVTKGIRWLRETTRR
jgi:transposase